MDGQSIYAFLIFTDTANCFPEMFINSYSSQFSVKVIFYTHSQIVDIKIFFPDLISKKCYLFIYTLIIGEAERVLHAY